MNNFSQDNSTLGKLLQEVQMTNEVVWTSDEILLLEQEVQKMDENEDELRTVLCIAPIFPHKSIQQISMRIRWMKSKRSISWEEYLKINDTRTHQSFNRNMSESSSNDNSSMSNSSISSNMSSPRPIHSDTLSKKSQRTSKSDSYLKTNKRGRRKEMSSGNVMNGTMSETYKNEINMALDKELTEKTINEIIYNNETLLNQLEYRFMYGDDSIETNKYSIMYFITNLNMLIDYTDDLAAPKELPFLPMTLNLTREMISIVEELHK